MRRFSWVGSAELNRKGSTAVFMYKQLWNPQWGVTDSDTQDDVTTTLGSKTCLNHFANCLSIYLSIYLQYLSIHPSILVRQRTETTFYFLNLFVKNNMRGWKFSSVSSVSLSYLFCCMLTSKCWLRANKEDSAHPSLSLWSLVDLIC